MNKVIEAAGATNAGVGRMGHGLGLAMTEWPSLMAGDDQPIEPNMVLTVEPGMEFAPNALMVHEENLLVTPDGPELLTRRAPPELPVIK
jgi:Xaa-Pro aminopeptidase